jgi:hypothetical protein
MEELFEVEKNENTCKDCVHRQRWRYGTKVFQYCEVNKCNLTSNGLKKVKLKTPACSKFSKDYFKGYDKDL